MMRTITHRMYVITPMLLRREEAFKSATTAKKRGNIRKKEKPVIILPHVSL